MRRAYDGVALPGSDDALKEAPILLHLIIKPVILRSKADEYTSGFAEVRDQNFLGFRLPQVAG